VAWALFRSPSELGKPNLQSPPNLFLQIIDLEHASLHMSCPIVPKDAPLSSLRQLQTSAKDPFYSLTHMMHTGLSHFTGRGLPTIWSFISSNQVSKFRVLTFECSASSVISRFFPFLTSRRSCHNQVFNEVMVTPRTPRYSTVLGRLPSLPMQMRK
jgi:hypothetical protein